MRASHVISAQRASERLPEATKALSADDRQKFYEWLEIILTFDHLTGPEIGWYINELSRRFKLLKDAQIGVFREKGLL